MEFALAVKAHCFWLMSECCMSGVLRRGGNDVNTSCWAAPSATFRDLGLFVLLRSVDHSVQGQGGCCQQLANNSHPSQGCTTRSISPALHQSPTSRLGRDFREIPRTLLM